MQQIDFDVKKIKNIVFDVGGILVGYRWIDMFKDHGTDEYVALRVGKGLFDSPNWSLYDAGVITTIELIDRFCEANPDLSDEARWFLDNAIQMRVLRPRVYKEVERLKEKGYKLYILSNYSHDLFELHTGDLPFRQLMDGELVSYMVNAIKPNKEIYDALTERFNLNPSESVFFDDRFDNVEGAKKQGYEGIYIDNADEELLLSYLSQF